MRTVEQKVYKFHELTDTAKESALDSIRETQCEFMPELLDWTISEFKETLEHVGFLEPKVYYDISCSQGSGSCFDCKYIDLSRCLEYIDSKESKKALRLRLDQYASASIKQTRNSNFYCHEMTRYLDLDIHTKRHYRVEYLLNSLREQIEELRLDLCSKIHSKLEQESDYYLSDECLIELIESNDYEFTETGKVY
jgi:hypothetical protein